jgi:hypothetical protein
VIVSGERALVVVVVRGKLFVKTTVLLHVSCGGDNVRHRVHVFKITAHHVVLL